MLLKAQIDRAPTPLKLTKLSDGAGLQLWLLPSGKKLWRFCYRFSDGIDLKQRAMKLGAYPTVGLKEARQLRDIARSALAEGRDPNPEEVDDAPATFGEVAEQWRQKQIAEGRAPSTVTRNDMVLAHVLPHLKDKPIADLLPVDVMKVLGLLTQRGHHETAARARMAISSIFRFAVITGRATTDPAAHLHDALARPKSTPRAAITDPGKFGRLLGMIDGFEGSPLTKAALKLLPLLACRPGELRLATWSEFDLAAKMWTIPEGRTKMRKEHRMHLPAQVIEILKELRKLTGPEGHLFPALGRAGRTMSENTINAALRSMGVAGTEHCAHGFRSSFSTIANESGKFRSDVIERHLAHVDRDSVRAVYNRAELWKERVELAEWWVAECSDMATLWG